MNQKSCGHNHACSCENLPKLPNPNIPATKQELEKFEQDLHAASQNVKSLEVTDRRRKPMAHLHLHTFHSILDGAGSIDNYVKLAKEYGHPAIGITDHGTLSGLFEFWQKCKNSGIKPILGMEAYVNNNMGEVEERKYEGGNSHQSIFIMNREGFVNLNKLAYKSFTEGFYKRGRIKTEWLVEHKNGLFLTTSCAISHMSKLVQEGKESQAEEYLLMLKREFGDNLVAELQLNEFEGQKVYNSWLLKMCKKYSLMPILTNDVHYAFQPDAELQDTLIAINQKSRLGESFRLSTRNLFYANADDFYVFNKKFGYNYPDNFIDFCLENTLKVVEKCTYDFEVGSEKYPRYEPTNDVIDYFKVDDTKTIISKLAFGKLKQKLNKYKETGIVTVTDEVVKQYYDRLTYELEVIDSKKMLDYFMVNWEIIRFCKENDIATGPGRGSAAGCLLSWCLDITKIDPIRFDLYFERFLNPSRNCLTENCNVLMRDGTHKNIKDITVGDPAQTEHGLGTLVQKHERELQEGENVFEIETEDGAKIELTGCHIVPVFRNGERIEVRVDEITETDLLFVF